MKDKLDPAKAAMLPIQHLAWVGDAVYELLVRQHLVVQGLHSPGKQAHKAAARLTSAEGQAVIVQRLQAKLNPSEQDLLRRGRNHKGLSRSTFQYCHATGLEVVVGWLWLSGQRQRINQLFTLILEEEGE